MKLLKSGGFNMKFERTHVYNFEEALYGMRLPLMSHSKE